MSCCLLCTRDEFDPEETPMCKLCDQGMPQIHATSRRDFFKATAATGMAAARLTL